MGRVSIGDVYGIDTCKGIALFQVVKFGKDPTCLDIIRVLDGFVASPDDPAAPSIVKKNELFFLHWPIIAAGSRRLNRMFRSIGNYPLPSELKIPTVFREEHRRKDGRTEWLTVTEDCVWKEIKVVDESYLQLSPWSVWSIPDLVERLENNWRLSDWR